MSATQTWPELAFTPLCNVDIRLAQPLVVGQGPIGKRVIHEATFVRCSGPRFNASMIGQANADWLMMSPDGRIGTLDVRCTLRTDDAALVLVTYSGRIRFLPSGVPDCIFVAPLFETEDPRYWWLNAVQAAGKGVAGEDGNILHYTFYELS
ncbi:MAG: DUF3237 domain-containing protein [Mesorhizobium sp.]|uniref:DUF3237 domain-containing protein n=1 Tax=Mesorhizobium sp. TaxID=1871066 RepID=UPI000FE9B3CD|nr:DUF3237 domain-containing protein [Mesorhizobium sp.]RWI54716.1 MAG: DUF3237 domain-containing protein [Mesorhizobium sp.]